MKLGTGAGESERTAHLISEWYSQEISAAERENASANYSMYPIVEDPRRQQNPWWQNPTPSTNNYWGPPPAPQPAGQPPYPPLAQQQPQQTFTQEQMDANALKTAQDTRKEVVAETTAAVVQEIGVRMARVEEFLSTKNPNQPDWQKDLIDDAVRKTFSLDRQPQTEAEFKLKIDDGKSVREIAAEERKAAREDEKGNKILELVDGAIDGVGKIATKFIEKTQSTTPFTLPPLSAPPAQQQPPATGGVGGGVFEKIPCPNEKCEGTITFPTGATEIYCTTCGNVFRVQKLQSENSLPMPPGHPQQQQTRPEIQETDIPLLPGEPLMPTPPPEETDKPEPADETEKGEQEPVRQSYAPPDEKEGNNPYEEDGF